MKKANKLHQNIYKYHLAHPDMMIKEVAAHFGMNQKYVGQVIRRQKNLKPGQREFSTKKEALLKTTPFKHKSMAVVPDEDQPKKIIRPKAEYDNTGYLNLLKKYAS